MNPYLYVCVWRSAGHHKALDYHTQLVLHSIGNVIKAILKPTSNLTPQDKVAVNDRTG